MPVEFSGAAFRLGHSMIRTAYNWNKHFNAAARAQGPIRSGHLFRLFRFSGTSGTLAPTDLPPGSAADLADLESRQPLDAEVLPANWVADFTRLFDLRRFGPAFTPADRT